MEINDNNWENARRIMKRASRTNLHFAVATTGIDGAPHVSAIGSLFLAEPGRGFYFEEYLPNMRRNLERDARVCVMAVDSGMLFWLRSLRRGRFTAPPGVRLYGRVGERRAATEEEMAMWRTVIKPLRRFRGYTLLWGGMQYVRDVEFHSLEPLHVGRMTEGVGF